VYERVGEVRVGGGVHRIVVVVVRSDPLFRIFELLLPRPCQLEPLVHYQALERTCERVRERERRGKSVAVIYRKKRDEEREVLRRREAVLRETESEKGRETMRSDRRRQRRRRPAQRTTGGSTSPPSPFAPPPPPPPAAASLPPLKSASLTSAPTSPWLASLLSLVESRTTRASAVSPSLLAAAAESFLPPGASSRSSWSSARALPLPEGVAPCGPSTAPPDEPLAVSCWRSWTMRGERWPMLQRWPTDWSVLRSLATRSDSCDVA